jgi:hypothetical protein
MSEGSHVAAARSLIALSAKSGGSVSQTQAAQAVRQAYSLEETSPRVWAAARAGLDALASAKGQPSADNIGQAIARAYGQGGPGGQAGPGGFPSALYGNKKDTPSQWATPERREALGG